MPVYMRRYYINKISNIHKEQEDAQQGNDNQKSLENFEDFDIDWDNIPEDSGLKNQL
jgi:hypothetical protein|tara:strand:- start:850 stop:1020 length:171 start_codon:yes stop_codon:yes gene_type:complete